MTYRIYVTKENFDIFEDGSKKCVGVSQGWYKDAYYNSMYSAKESLAKIKDALKVLYDVTEVNSVTLLGVRDRSNYSGERFAPMKREEKVIYHIEKR